MAEVRPVLLGHSERHACVVFTLRRELVRNVLVTPHPLPVPRRLYPGLWRDTLFLLHALRLFSSQWLPAFVSITSRL